MAIGLIVFAFLSSLYTSIPRLIVWFRTQKLHKKQKSISLVALDELKGRIHGFADFVSIARSDSLYNAVFRKICNANQSDTDSIMPVPPILFAGILEHLKNRVDREQHFDSLKRSASEFNSLVGWFSTYAVCPVYDRVPNKLSPKLLNNYYSQQVANDLIQFRERFDRFLDGYTEFLRELDRRLPEPLNIGYYFERPRASNHDSKIRYDKRNLVESALSASAHTSCDGDRITSAVNFRFVHGANREYHLRPR